MIAQHDRQTDSPSKQLDDRTKSVEATPRSRRAIGPLFRLVPSLRAHRRLSVLAATSLTAAALISLALPIAVRRMIDNGFSRTDGDFINRYFLMLIVLAIALALASACRYYFVTVLGERVVSDLRQAVFRKITRMPASFFDANRSGEIASRLSADAAQIKAAVSLTASVALRNSILCFGALAMMFVTSPGLSAIAIGAIPLVVAPMIIFGRSVRKKSRAAQDRLADASAFASEMIAGAPTVQAFNFEDAACRNYAADVEVSYLSSVAAARARAMLTAVAIALVSASVVGVLWIGAHSLLAGTISAGSLSQFLIYSIIAAGSLGSLSEVWGELAQAAGAAERLFELLDEKGCERATGATIALGSPVRGAVQISDLHFRYPGAPEQEVLSGLSLKIEPGETVAIVGPSGSGKSTLFSLLLGFYENYGGSISVDGRDIKVSAHEELRRAISIVPQDVMMFAAPISENIALGRPDADADDIVAAAVRACAHQFISALPKGYDTVVGERGMTLSGGQRQRIAIARAALKNAPILLLDEATAALDAENESLVQEGLEDLMGDRTTIVVAHRLATVLKADRILVMDHGRIVEEGTHASLIRKGGLYSRLAELQFEPARPPEQDAA
ncbi:ABC transporter transmembrane domain-containing protein [Rhizobium hidalgonense]|uniref:ABC transporter transmembrane domain-containing protein n=1 Tax=Rhizobium hidalgonense TaxID=1538159 RepID=UPI0028723651|nr:ABC transporter transmembrane domain-containing protein [Rhizobium hidalgonense]MDR9808765.1 ABC transporter transmembrane domain-containing protein [Rhizobium hidalgonense]